MTDLAILKDRLNGVEVAERLGIKHRGNAYRCPVHDADKPASTQVFADGFKCHRSGEAGDVLALIQHSQECTFKQALDIAQGIASPIDQVQKRKPKRSYPPGIVPFWESCRHMSQQAMDWLDSRGLGDHVDRIVELDLMRVVPKRDLPPWAWRGELPIVTPMFNHKGVMKSVRFRSVEDSSARWPIGEVSSQFECRGLVMANALARDMLSSSTVDRAIILEGEPDYLSVSVSTDAPVIGILSGAWTTAFSKRVVENATLYLATDNNPAGEEYARKIAASVTSRNVFRCLP